MISQSVTLPYCDGVLSQDPQTNAPVCSGVWRTIQTLALDPANQATLGAVLDTGGVDWTTVEWIFGSGLILFATGAGIGGVINLVRKARNP